MGILGQKKKKFEVNIIAREKSDYNDIYVMQKGSKRDMWFRKKNDFFLQSRIDINQLDTLVLIYTQMLTSALLLQPVPSSILMIGLGGCAMSNFLARLYPDAVLDVVEIDQKIIDISKQFFYFQETPNYKIHKEDGRRFIQKMSGKKQYDLIYLDAFKSGSIPFHLKTIQFYEDLMQVLSSEGVVGSNLYGKSNLLKSSDWKTFSNKFNQIYCFEDHDSLATVLLASNRKEVLTKGELIRAAREFPFLVPFSLTDVANMYSIGKFKNDNGDIFIDDFAQEEFDCRIEKNNRDDIKNPLYPIKNTG
tara:strand:- start:82 stop:996 length:915 start_codon:yes stop_codon:yes gene_type:complete